VARRETIAFGSGAGRLVKTLSCFLVFRGFQPHKASRRLRRWCLIAGRQATKQSPQNPFKNARLLRFARNDNRVSEFLVVLYIREEPTAPLYRHGKY
jgi:hypothetical protein